MHALIVGDRGVGKSTLIRRVLAELNRPLFGYETKKEEQLEDPIRGLAPFCALPAFEGNGWYNPETGEYSGYNCFYYNGTPILPRGYLAKFVPEKSGVYQSYCGPEKAILDHLKIF